jgi:hypothetical protein
MVSYNDGCVFFAWASPGAGWPSPVIACTKAEPYHAASATSPAPPCWHSKAIKNRKTIKNRRLKRGQQVGPPCRAPRSSHQAQVSIIARGNGCSTLDLLGFFWKTGTTTQDQHLRDACGAAHHCDRRTRQGDRS